jgi:hypothetical protein
MANHGGVRRFPKTVEVIAKAENPVDHVLIYQTRSIPEDRSGN